MAEVLVELVAADLAEVSDQVVHLHIGIDPLELPDVGLRLVLTQIRQVQVLTGRIGRIDAVEVVIGQRPQPAADEILGQPIHAADEGDVTLLHAVDVDGGTNALEVHG